MTKRLRRLYPRSIGNEAAEKAVWDARQRKEFRAWAKRKRMSLALIPGTWRGVHIRRIGTRLPLRQAVTWAKEEVFDRKSADWIEIRDVASWRLLAVVTNEMVR